MTILKLRVQNEKEVASLVVFLTTFKHSITKFKSHYHSSLESVAGLAHRVNPGVVELPSSQQVYLAHMICIGNGVV